MYKYILLIALASAQTNSTSEEMKPGDLDEYYEIDFEQDPDFIEDDQTQDDSELMDQLPEFNENGFMNLLQDVNSCGVQIVYKYNITQEVKHIYEQVVDPEVLDGLENHEREELRETIHDIVGPMFAKLMGSDQAGEIVVDNLSQEVINWLKDTIVMLVKNHGNVDGYKFKEYGVEETMLSKEQCDAVHQPAFDLYEQANNNLTAKIALSDDRLQICRKTEDEHLAEIDEINHQKFMLETNSESQIENLKNDLQRVRKDLSSMTQLYVALNNTKATESNKTASGLLRKCRVNFKKAQKVCYTKLDRCEDKLEKEEDDTKRLIKSLTAGHKDKLVDEEKDHNRRIKNMKKKIRTDKANAEKKIAKMAKDMKFQKKIVTMMTNKFYDLESLYEDTEEEQNQQLSEQNKTIEDLKRQLKEANEELDELLEEDEGNYSEYDAEKKRYTYNTRPSYGYKSYFNYAKRTPTSYYSGKNSYYYVKPKTYYSYFSTNGKNYYGYYGYYNAANFRNNRRSLEETSVIGGMFDWLF